MFSGIIFRLKWIGVGLLMSALYAYVSGVNMTQYASGIGKFFSAIIQFFGTILKGILPSGGGHLPFGL